MRPALLVEIMQPWTPAQATERIRALIQDPGSRLHYSKHAKEQMMGRDLIIGDVIYLLKNGFVYDEPVPSHVHKLYKYIMTSPTPNSGSREVGVVVIPDWRGKALKIVTVMWLDEVRQSS